MYWVLQTACRKSLLSSKKIKLPVADIIFVLVWLFIPQCGFSTSNWNDNKIVISAVSIVIPSQLYHHSAIK
jgi:hypothetical protein